MSKKANVLVICASIRSTGRKTNHIINMVEKYNSPKEILEFYYSLNKKELSKFSNSEIMSSLAMSAARLEGVNVDYFSLRRLFKVNDSLRINKDKSVGLDDELYHIDSTSIKKESLNLLINKVKKADSIILSSPVYFGDRSSVADYFLKLIHKQNLVKGKAFSVISVGAKRNGGQETTNVYALFDAICMGGFGIGNGPKTSQYGGTCVGGDRGDIINDEYGIETTLGTGRRSAQVAKILFESKFINSNSNKVKVGVLITCDNSKKDIQKRTEEALSRLNCEFVQYEIVNLIDHKVERCLACNICPYPPMIKNGSRGKTYLGKTDYSCIIDNGKDSVEIVKDRLKGMRGLIIVSANDDSIEGLVDQYQSFTERTRFIRRNNFEWMNTVITSLVFKDIGSSRDRLFGLRSTTSYLRHNTIATSPNRVLTVEGNEVSFPKESLEEFLINVKNISDARLKVDPVTVSYVAGGTGGYSDTSLDNTSSKRR